jgi:uncharacterized protein (UPF0276 family)
MPAPCALSPRAAGLGWRTELAADLLSQPAAADLVEVVAETCFAQPRALREAHAIAEVWPVIPHGVKLSLGSADGIETARARRLGTLARELRAPAVSEHVALTRGGSREIGHLTAVPFTRQQVRVVARNVAALRRHLPDVPLLLENIAWTLRFPEDEMGEGAFHAEVAEATGCELLLDLANLYANALNAGLPPLGLLRSYPLHRVGMVHLAGGVHEQGFYLDTHAHAIPAQVYELLAELLRVRGPVPVIVERDARFPAFDELRAEVARARELLHAAPDVSRPRPRATASFAGGDEPGLAARQRALAELLTDPEPRPDPTLDPAAIARSRMILHRKRVDDALPLLPRTSAAGEALQAIALRALHGAPRSPSRAAIADARRIAEAATSEPGFAAAARLDLLELRARFGPDRQLRRAPFAGRETLPDGSAAWALKGPGREATIVFLGHCRTAVPSGGSR